MRVAYLVGRYPAVSHTFILREVQALRERGVEVHPISINRARPEDTLAAADREEAARTYAVLPPHPARLALNHLRVVCTRPRACARALRLALWLARPGLRGLVYELFYLAEAVMVWAHCRALGVRHIHVHHLNQASDAAMLAIALEGGGRWTWSYTMHGPDEFLDRSSFRLATKAQDAAAIACISDFARSQVMAVLDEAQWPKLRIVHCGLAPGEFVPPPTRDRPPGTPLRLLYVGRLVPVKGQTVLLEAVAQLVREGQDVALTLVGEGPQQVVVEQRARALGIADRVDAVGAVGQDDIRGHFAAADVFVLPSFAEGVPVVLMEAMATALPVVTTRIAGIPELVEDGVSGVLVAPGRPDALAAAIARLAADPELRARMGAAGGEKVRAEYDVRDSAAALEALFAEVLTR